MLRWLEVESTALDKVIPSTAAPPPLLVELGSGAGLLGFACAALIANATLVLTDVAELVPFAQRSIAANEPALASRCVARPLPFGDAAALDAVLGEFAAQAPAPAVVAVGAGIFYWECVYTPLAETLEHLCCRAGGQALLGYFRRDWKVERRFWTKLLPQRGLEVEILWEGVAPEPTDTATFAPVCTRTLDGEWNARVYRIVRAQGGNASGTGGDAAPAAATASDEQAPWLAYKANDKKQSGKKKGSGGGGGGGGGGGRKGGR
eukprot:NODE_18775_length_877_cov_3.458667.p1 GENE.NODE_18775_length_877_cov_3.458667~~NODE_18775_length_877_cov_3.458667.p1  ORF type:complete len:284 (+),score=121.07 NODE_18775_length_877_cov_3.458667:65-853(+)